MVFRYNYNMVSITRIYRSRFTGGVPASRNLAVAALVFLLLFCGPARTSFSAAIEPVHGGPSLTGEHAGPENTYFQGPLRVMTLNMAHGRKTAFSQIYLSWQTIHANLMGIGAVLKSTKADIVALQEADGPSWWSGNFDHVALLADTAGYPWFARAGYMNAWALDYGAALLSRRPFLETRAHRLKKFLVFPSKGFLLGRFGWYPQGEASGKPVFIDIVSIHLGFSRSAVRNRQLVEMRAVLADRHNPLIILGDFNTDWLADASVVRELTRKTGLQVYRPEAVDMETYGSRRLDWILISADLEFLNYEVIPDIISDHRGIKAVIGYRGPKAQRSKGPRGSVFALRASPDKQGGKGEKHQNHTP